MNQHWPESRTTPAGDVSAWNFKRHRTLYTERWWNGLWWGVLIGAFLVTVVVVAVLKWAKGW